MMAEALDVEAIVIDRSAEKETLKLLFHYLVNSIDAAALLPAALSASLITEQQRSDCASEADPYKKAEKFVGHLQRAVNGDTANFRKFLKVLHITNQGSIATRLQSKRKACYGDRTCVYFNVFSLYKLSAISCYKHTYEQTYKRNNLLLLIGDIQL